MNSMLWLLFSFNGRIGRLSFALASLVPSIALAGCIVLVLHLLGSAGIGARTSGELAVALYASVGPAGCAMAVALVVGIGWMGAAVQGKRLQDFGWNGFWVLAPVALDFLASFGGELAATSKLPASLAALADLAATKAWLANLAFVGMMLVHGGDQGPNGFERDEPKEAGRKAAAAVTAPDAMASAALFSEGESLSGAASSSAFLGIRQPARDADGVVLATYRAPQDRSAGFGRRRAA